MSIHKRARKLITERDALMHNSWGTNAEGAVGKRRLRDLTPLTPVPLEQLEKSILDIRFLIGDIQVQMAKLVRDSSRAK
jgi:hypothetical protein